jgi:hypothetical protein
MLIKLGIDAKGNQLRNRRIWHCAYCTEWQFAEANSHNKEGHLRKHGITQHGKKTPTYPLDRYAATHNDQPVLRQKEAYIQLTTAVMLDPFKEALVAFVVICQVALSLVVNDLFVEFLELVYPTVLSVLPRASNTIREWVIEAFQARKEKVKEVLARSNSKIHFSFDLWTSPNHLALLGIVAHYIDEYGQNQSVSNDHVELFAIVGGNITTSQRDFLITTIPIKIMGLYLERA